MYVGGTERVTVTKANALSEIPGNEVYVVVTDNYKPHAFQLNDKVHLVNLKVNYWINENISLIKGLFFDNRKKLHRERLQAFFDELEPDVVVSVGWSEKYILANLRYIKKPLLIRELHYTKHYRKIIANSFKQKVIAYLSEFYDFDLQIKKYDYIAVLTNEDKENNWKENNKVIVMPNPAVKCDEIPSKCEDKTAIAVGRLIGQKNFSSLIRVWEIVNKKYPDWKLKIFGEGQLNHELQKQIEGLGLVDSIFLMGRTNMVYKEMQKSSLYLMTSLFEGFPLVILEAMSIGLPVVSYGCPTGPRDIIVNGENGFLIQLHNEKAMSEKIIWLIEHSDERKRMGQNAFETSKEYTPEKIAYKWMCLFNKGLNKVR